MKKYFSVLIFTALIIPSVTFAAWWNPTTWFNEWSFSYTQDTKTQALEDRIKELEKKLNTQADVISSLPKKDVEEKTEPVSVKSNLDKEVPTKPIQPKKETGISNPTTVTATQPATTIIPQTPPVATPIPVVQNLRDFRAECTLSKNSIKKGEMLRAKIDIFFESLSAYNITWNSKYLTRVIDTDEALFTPKTTDGVSATMTRKSDGYSKVVVCPSFLLEEKKEEVIVEKSECELLAEEIIVMANDRVVKERQTNEQIREIQRNSGGMSSSAMNSTINQVRNQHNILMNELANGLTAKQIEYDLQCN